MPRRNYKYKRSRSASLAELITGLIFLAFIGAQSWFASLSPEWRTFLFLSIPFTIVVGIVTFGVIFWYNRRYQKQQEERQRIFEAKQQRITQIQHENARLVQFKRTSQVAAIKLLNPLALERYVAELFERTGYKTSLTALSGDHGIDVHLVNKLGQKEVAQCKQWPSRNKGLVGEPELRDFYGAMMAENAVMGYMVAPHGFTQEAIRWAIGKPIALVDSNWLFTKASELGLWAEEPLTDNSSRQQTSNPPLCPKCGASTVIRVARRGPHIGERFYGCSNYPKCSTFILIDDHPKTIIE